MLNNKKGITLIALVVTVVVLIILAGVSINAVLGDNGIIKKANQAASVTKEAEVKEAINRTILEFYLTNDYETLEDFLKAKAEDGSIDSVTKNADGTLTVKKGNYSVTVENKTNSSGGSSSGGSTGGETQTPFYISILASFAQLYRTKSNDNTIRLIVFDEAFSKMDSERIEESIKLLKKIQFQAIFAAPPEKLQDIQALVDSTLLVLNPEEHEIVVKKYTNKEE